MPSAALADMVWPALYVEQRLFSWWAISIGLVIEVAVVKWLFALPPWRAGLAAATANAVSSLLGVVLIPLAGVAWEIFPGILLYTFANMGTFNPLTWISTFLIACFLNTALESLIYRRAFTLPTNRRTFWAIAGANAASVGAAFASLYIRPIQS